MNFAHGCTSHALAIYGYCFKDVEKSRVEATQIFDIRRFMPFNFICLIYTVDEIEATWLYPYLLGMQNASEARIRGHTASSA